MKPEEDQILRKNKFSTIGLSIALLVMILSLTSPWIAGAISPPESVEDQAVAKVLSIKDKLAKGLKGEEYKSEEKQFSFVSALNFSIIFFAAVAVILGVLGFVKREDNRMSGAAIAIGASLVLFQYFLMLAAALIVLFLVGAILKGLFITDV